MLAVVESIHDGPFGNPETTIRTGGISLWKNPLLEEAYAIYQQVMNKRDIKHVAMDARNLMSYAIGTMFAKLDQQGLIANVDKAFLDMASIFDLKKGTKTPRYRFNRRTVFEALQVAGHLPKNATIKDAKPAGTFPTIHEISRIVENYYMITQEQVKSPARSRKVVEARFVTIWAMRNVCGHSLTYIGEQLGKRDHTSILNGVNRMRKIRESNVGERHAIDNICDETDLLALRRHHAILTNPAKNLRLI